MQRIEINGILFTLYTWAILAVSISTVKGANLSLIFCRPSSVINVSPVTIRPQCTFPAGSIFLTAAFERSTFSVILQLSITGKKGANSSSPAHTIPPPPLALPAFPFP